MRPTPVHLKNLTRVPLSSGASGPQQIKGEPAPGSPFLLHLFRMFSSEGRSVGRLPEEGE